MQEYKKNYSILESYVQIILGEQRSSYLLCRLIFKKEKGNIKGMIFRLVFIFMKAYFKLLCVQREK